MLKRIRGYIVSRSREGTTSFCQQLEDEGYTIRPQVFGVDKLQALRDDINRIFDEFPADARSNFRSKEDDQMFRYEMLNRSEVCQDAVAHPLILAVIEPLIGEDCHVIANTAWRNPAGQESAHAGQNWHIDAGPHVPRPADTEWPDEIPYPIFAIGIHIYLQDCSNDDGPTGVIPGSHKSGQIPPRDQLGDENLQYNGRAVEALIARAGDVGFFVSDTWHRRLPTSESDRGRFFLQVHYARRDIAQRLHTTSATNQLAPRAIKYAKTDRQKTIIGLHHPIFYDG